MGPETGPKVDPRPAPLREAGGQFTLQGSKKWAGGRPEGGYLGSKTEPETEPEMIPNRDPK